MSYEENGKERIIKEIKKEIYSLPKDIGVYKFMAVALAGNLIESLKHLKKTERLNDFELGKIEILRNMLVHGYNFNLEKTMESIEDHNTKQSLQNFCTLVKDTSEKEKIYLLNSILLKNKNYLPKNDSLEDFSFDIDKLKSFFDKIRKSKANDFYEFREQNRKKLKEIKISQEELLTKLGIKQIEQNIFEEEKKKLEEQQQEIEENLSVANSLCHVCIAKDIEELRSDIEKTRPPQPQNKEFLDKLLQSAADIDKMMSQHLQQNKKQKGKH